MDRSRQALHRFWGLKWWVKAPVIIFAALIVIGIAGAAIDGGARDGSVAEPAPTVTSAATRTPRSTATPTDTPTAEPTATATEPPSPTPLPPTATRVPPPPPTATPLPPPPPPPTAISVIPPCGAPPNPWGFDFCPGGDYIYSPPAEFCSYFACIGNFWNGRGYVIQCPRWDVQQVRRNPRLLLSPQRQSAAAVWLLVVG